MRVRGGVGMAMVVAVVRSPPQWAALHAGGADQREHELQHARRAERAVREVAVIEAGDREHAHGVERHCRDHRGRRYADPQHGHARKVHADEGDGTQPVDLAGAACVFVIRHLRVEPATHGRQTACRQRGEG
ncbi:hypothetical protein FQZ97_1036470 [compost metagenome]